jgi:hypothetical protein
MGNHNFCTQLDISHSYSQFDQYINPPPGISMRGVCYSSCAAEPVYVWRQYHLLNKLAIHLNKSSKYSPNYHIRTVEDFFEYHFTWVASLQPCEDCVALLL